MAKDKTKDKKKSTADEKESAPVDDSTKDEGSFTYGSCKNCEWRGRARRSRGKARSDAEGHETSCKGKHKVKLKTTDHRD